MAQVQNNNKKIKLRKSARLDRKLQRQNIPELCLDAIFGHIRLEDLLTGSAGQISKCWYNAQARELATKRRQTLFLTQDKDNGLVDLDDNNFCKDQTVSYDLKREDGSPILNPMKPLSLLKFNVVYFPGGRLNAKFVSKLINFLPKITHLVVLAKVDIDNAELEQVVRLLDHYSTHLVKLKLNLSKLDQPIQPETVTRLFATINSLEVLDHLKLSINFTKLEHELPLLSIMSRLTTFSYDSQCYYSRSRDWLKSSLSRYAGGEKLRSIGLEVLNMETLLELDPQILAKFQWVDICDSILDYDLKLQLFSRFNSVTYLQLWVCSIPINRLAQCLAQMPSLIYFKLDIMERIEVDEEFEIPQHVVPSVLQLYLYIQTEVPHDEVKHLNLAKIFPNLQIIQIKHQAYLRRNYFSDKEMTNFDSIVKCRRKARETMLAGCVNLRRIIYESEDPNDGGQTDVSLDL